MITAMNRWRAVLAGLPIAISAGAAADQARPGLSCATVVIAKGETVLVGHNLDESIPVPGMIVVNKRGVAKKSVSYADVRSGGVGSGALSWTSRYGSLTYNSFGREFPDGGLNEAGLYVGEMTLLGSVYPSGGGLVGMYHNAWMQYLLDSFSTVDEVIASLARVVPEGHCQWHFMVADRSGRAAVIEFDEGKTLVYTGENLPVPVSTNYTYPSCLKKLATFEGFGGAERIDLGEKCSEKDRRFIWAAAMLRDIGAAPTEPTVEQAMAVLRRMWCDANRWALVADVRAMRLWFNTDRARRLRFIDMGRLDFSCATPVTSLDVNADLEGDVTARLEPLTDEANHATVKAFFSGVDAGMLGNLFWKKTMVRGLTAYPRTCACAR